MVNINKKVAIGLVVLVVYYFFFERKTTDHENEPAVKEPQTMIAISESSVKRISSRFSSSSAGPDETSCVLMSPITSGYYKDQNRFVCFQTKSTKPPSGVICPLLTNSVEPNSSSDAGEELSEEDRVKFVKLALLDMRCKYKEISSSPGPSLKLPEIQVPQATDFHGNKSVTVICNSEDRKYFETKIADKNNNLLKAVAILVCEISNVKGIELLCSHMEKAYLELLDRMSSLGAGSHEEIEESFSNIQLELFPNIQGEIAATPIQVHVPEIHASVGVVVSSVCRFQSLLLPEWYGETSTLATRRKIFRNGSKEGWVKLKSQLAGCNDENGKNQIFSLISSIDFVCARNKRLSSKTSKDGKQWKFSVFNKRGTPEFIAKKSIKQKLKNSFKSIFRKNKTKIGELTFSYENPKTILGIKCNLPGRIAFKYIIPFQLDFEKSNTLNRQDKRTLKKIIFISCESFKTSENKETKKRLSRMYGNLLSHLTRSENPLLWFDHFPDQYMDLVFNDTISRCVIVSNHFSSWFAVVSRNLGERNFIQYFCFEAWNSYENLEICPQEEDKSGDLKIMADLNKTCKMKFVERANLLSSKPSKRTFKNCNLSTDFISVGICAKYKFENVNKFMGKKSYSLIIKCNNSQESQSEERIEGITKCSDDHKDIKAYVLIKCWGIEDVSNSVSAIAFKIDKAKS